MIWLNNKPQQNRLETTPKKSSRMFSGGVYTDVLGWAFPSSALSGCCGGGDVFGWIASLNGSKDGIVLV